MNQVAVKESALPGSMENRRKQFMDALTTVPLLIIDDFGTRKFPLTAADFCSVSLSTSARGRG